VTSGVPALDALTVEPTRPRTDTVLVRVHGTLDRASAPVLDRALQRQAGPSRPRRLVLDLSDAEFLGLPGVTVLVRAHRRTEAVAGAHPPCLVGLSAAEERMLGLLGVRDLFHIHDGGDMHDMADQRPAEGTTR